MSSVSGSVGFDFGQFVKDIWDSGIFGKGAIFVAFIVFCFSLYLMFRLFRWKTEQSVKAAVEAVAGKYIDLDQKEIKADIKRNSDELNKISSDLGKRIGKNENKIIEIDTRVSAIETDIKEIKEEMREDHRGLKSYLAEIFRSLKDEIRKGADKDG